MHTAAREHNEIKTRKTRAVVNSASTRRTPLPEKARFRPYDENGARGRMSAVKRLIYRLWRLGGFAALARFLAQRRLKIVLYHGVCPSVEGLFNYRRKFIAPQSFERQITYFTRHYTILPLDEAVMRLYAGKLPPRALAITFDDGYRNNYEYAFPILKKYGVPATVFLATDFVFDNTPLWVDRLEHATAHGSESVYEKKGMDNRMRSEMKTLSEAEKIRRLEAIERKRGAALTDARADVRYAPLEPHMLEEMQKAGIAFGAHTKSHPILSRISLDDARTEITESIDVVKNICTLVSRVFAYPNGQPGDWTNDIEDMLIKHDFDSALTTVEGTNGASAPRMRLKRISMDDTDDWDSFVAAESGLRGILQELKKVWSY